MKLTAAGVVPSKSDRSDLISIEELVERAPDAFVIVDMEGIIRKTNQAFVDLVEVGSKGLVMGERLARWLWRPGADVAVLLANLQRNRMVRLFSTTIHSEFGTATEVEISAAGNADFCPRYVGVSVRDVSRRLPSKGSDPVRESLGLSSDQLGKTPLRRLVRNNVSALEQYYVKAALELANGNRTAAAVILGLSRQTLYAKLDRYGLERETDTAPEDSN